MSTKAVQDMHEKGRVVLRKSQYTQTFANRKIRRHRIFMKGCTMGVYFSNEFPKNSYNVF